MEGVVLDQYEVREKVGEGAMATVYRGRHAGNGEAVAIKVLHPHLIGNERTRARFGREAQVIAAMDCVNIPRIHAFRSEGDGVCYLVTDFVKGPTLRALLDRVGRIPSEPAALIVHQVCNALAVAHGQSVIHRDIKPANIMVDAGGVVKLMDFGVARLLDEATLTLTGTLVGSPAFMSPEQARNVDIDGRSDLFSIGTLLFLMTSGQLPFVGRSPTTLLGSIIDGDHLDPVDVVPDIHPGLSPIIDRCLEPDRDNRHSDVAALRADIEESLLASGIDPDDPGEWSLEAYLADAGGYEQRLVDQVVNHHTDRGRSLIEEGRASDAMPLLNRVLTLDEGNQDVIDMLSSPRE